MSKPRASRRSSVPSVPSVPPADVAVAVVPPADVVAGDASTVPPAFDVVDAVRAMHANAGVPLPDTFVVPPAFVAFVGIVRDTIAPMVTRTGSARTDYAGMVRELSAAIDASPAFVPANVATPHTTRYAGMGITDAQNAWYHAIAASGVFVPADVVCVVWRAFAPHARCDYIGRAIPRGYATTTLSAYMRGDHGSGAFPGAVDAIRPWYVAGGVTRPPKP